MMYDRANSILEELKSKKGYEELSDEQMAETRKHINDHMEEVSRDYAMKSFQSRLIAARTFITT